MPGTAKLDLYAHLAVLAKAVAHEHRLGLLELVAQGERSVEVLAAHSSLSLANASQHLQQLRRAGLVVGCRRGKFIFYRLADEAVLGMIAAMRTVAERNVGEVAHALRAYFHERDQLEPVSRAEVATRMKLGLITVIDVRPKDEFALGHIAGARSVPLTELKRHSSKLNRKLEIVAYCRGPYCMLAFEAVAQLRKLRFKARRLQDGLPEWRAAGLPIETPAASAPRICHCPH